MLPSSDIVLPGLALWAQRYLAFLLLALTPDAFDTAFDHFMAPNASVTLNGEGITRDVYKQALKSESNVTCQGQDMQVNFTDVLVLVDDIALTRAGVVGLVYNATCGSATIVSSLHLSIDRNATACPKSPGSIRGDCDPRIVAEANIICPQCVKANTTDMPLHL
ncbi:hypothetical protein B0H11DRAFT_2218854 [Mycena galericulata]|nr:hypothetical protein B0H11DRAFT_2247825 [Mycena galericulata]KAJ7507016.1 hypothetical protein B0H11DRAFT_2218854 [Mycena galericulata]